MADELPPLIAELRGDASDLMSTIAQVESALNAFASKDWEAQLGLDTTKALEELAAFESVAQSQTITIPVTLDIGGALAQLAALGAAGQAVGAGTGGGRGGFGAGGGAGPGDAALASLLSSARTRSGAAAIAELYGLSPQVTEDAKKVAQLTEADLQSMESINRSINAAKTAAALSSIDAQLIAERTNKALAVDTSIAGAAETIAARNAASGDQGGGGGGGGLLAALGFGSAASKGIFGLGAGLAGFGTLGSLAGLGPESLLTTGLGIAGSAAGGLVGGGALALGSAAVAGVGLGTDAAGLGQAAKDAQTYTQELDKLNRAIAVYGANSIEAKAAQYDLNNTMQALTPAAQAGVIALSQAGQQFHTVFDQMTGAAEATGAAILTQLLGVAQKFLPTIGKFASENMTIIQASLQPLFTWLQGPGLGIFKQLEQTFQDQLPTAMHAFDQGIELLIRTLGFLAPYTGHLITFLDDLFTKLNGSGWDNFTKGINTAITIFRDWEGLIKAVGTAIYELFTHDAGTGTDIIKMLTEMVNKFNAWAQSVAGGDELHSLLESHKNEILAILQLLGNLISVWGQLEVTVRPILQDLVAGLADILNFLFKIPGIGQLAGLIIAFEILGSHIGILGGALSSFNNLLKNLALDGIHALGGALANLSGPLGSLGTWLQGLGVTGPTAAEKAAASMQAAADSMAASAAQISESMGSIGIAATDAAATVDASMGTMDASLAATAFDAEASAATVDAALASEGVAGAGAAAGGAAAATAGGVGAAGAAGAGGVAGIAAAAAPAALALGAVAIAMYGLVQILPNGNNQISAFQSTLNKITSTAPQNIADLNNKMAATTQVLNQATTAAQHFNENLLPTASGSRGRPVPVGPDLTTISAQAQGDLTKYNAMLGTYRSNVSELSSVTGLAAPYVNNLANALGVNLTKALNPSTVEQFTNYIKQQGGTANVVGQQWNQSSQTIQAALQLLSAKAQQTMPNVSAAVANMVVATQPSLLTLISNATKAGNGAGAGIVSAFLSHLTPAQMASKSLHDRILSPLEPLVGELYAVNDDALAKAVQTWIDHQPAASNASKGMHDAVVNPLKSLASELAANGDTTGYDFVQDYIKHTPGALNASGQMKQSTIDGLQGIEQDLANKADAGGAAFVQAAINEAKLATPAGQQFVTDLIAGVDSQASTFAQHVQALVNGAVQNLTIHPTITVAPGVTVTPVSTQGYPVQARAAGGPIDAGKTYLVGEDGPELFSAGYNGAILPISMNSAGQTQAIPAALSGALGSGYGGIDPTSLSTLQSVVQQVSAALTSFKNVIGVVAQGMGGLSSAIGSLANTVTQAISSIGSAGGALGAASAVGAATSAATSFSIGYGGNPITQTINSDGSVTFTDGKTGQPISTLAGYNPLSAPTTEQRVGSLPTGNVFSVGAINPVAPSQSPAIGNTVLQVTTPFNIDGRTIASTVTQYQLRGARATSTVLGQYAGGTQSQTATGLNTNAVPR